MKFGIGMGLALAVLTTPAIAQDNEVAPGASNELSPVKSVGTDGFGDCLAWGPWDADACSGETGNLGITPGDGGYHVSTRGLVAPSHMVFVTDDAGNCVAGAEYAQIPASASSSWGYRDGANSGSKLYWGWEGGLAEHNLDGSGGIEFFSGSAPGSVGTWRAMAYDPIDGGSLWVANFGSDLIRVTLADPGVPADLWPNNDGWSLYGLALDPQTGNLWGHTTNGDVIEIDTTTGRTTGVSYPGASCASAFAAQGGLSGVPGGIGGSGNTWDIVGLSQGSPDEIFGMEGYGDTPGMLLEQTGGTCGVFPVQLTVTGATTGNRIALVWGKTDGSTAVPMCPGLVVDINEAQVAGIMRAVGGVAEFCGQVRRCGCPIARVQAVDIDGCTTSNKIIGLN